MWTIGAVIYCAHETKFQPGLHSCSGLFCHAQVPSGGSGMKYSAIQPQACSYQGTVSFFSSWAAASRWERHHHLLRKSGRFEHGRKKRNWSGESELLLPVNEKRPCWVLGVLPEVTPIWSDSHAFGNEGLITEMRPRPSGNEDLTFPLHSICLSWSTGNNTVSTRK